MQITDIETPRCTAQMHTNATHGLLTVLSVDSYVARSGGAFVKLSSRSPKDAALSSDALKLLLKEGMFGSCVCVVCVVHLGVSMYVICMRLVCRECFVCCVCCVLGAVCGVLCLCLLGVVGACVVFV